MININEKCLDRESKVKFKNELYLFTEDGNKAVLEYMRNLTPQVLIGGVWILLVMRSSYVSDLFLWFITLIMAFIFMYMVIANIVDFIQKITNHMDSIVHNIPEYSACENTNDLKIWTRHLVVTLKLVLKNRKILFLEFILAIFFLLFPTAVVFFASVNTGVQFLKSITGG